MKSMGLFLGSVLLATQVFAATKFTCSTDRIIEGKKPTVIHFAVEKMTAKSVVLSELNPEGEPFVTVPKNSILDLNENWSASLDEHGNFHASSDGDGCQWTDFVIYKNSGFKKGFVRVKDTGCASATGYSTVTCVSQGR